MYLLNGFDGVAAKTLKEAKEWYLKTTGLNKEDAFYDYEASEMALDFEVWRDESRQSKQSLKSVIQEHWKGEPFLVISSECDTF